MQKRPTNMQKRPSQYKEGDPWKGWKERPTNIQKRPTNMQKRPTNMQKRPTNMQKRPTNMHKRPSQYKEGDPWKGSYLGLDLGFRV